MTLGELTDVLQKYCNMGYSQEEFSVVNNSYNKKKMTVEVKVGNDVTVIFDDRKDKIKDEKYQLWEIKEND